MDDVARRRRKMRELGLRIRKLREARGLSVAELAERLDCAPDHVYRWELGYVDPKSSTLERLAIALRCGVGELLPATG